jgi:hypothetical protein
MIFGSAFFAVGESALKEKVWRKLLLRKSKFADKKHDHRHVKKPFERLNANKMYSY